MIEWRDPPNKKNAQRIAQALDDTSKTFECRSEEDIARRAYDLYLARGCEHGHDVDDWLEAERELVR